MAFARESSIVFRRQIRMNLRNPAWVLIGIMQPVLYLLLFGPLLEPLVSSFGVSTDNAYTFLVPGLLVQLGLFGAFFAGIVLGIIITLIVGGACAAASNALALTTKSEDVMAPVINIVMMPVLLLSGILLPMTIGPEWLQNLANLMPFKYIVDGVRDAFAGSFGTSSVLWGTVWAVVLAALGTWWGTATFRQENA